MFRILLILTSFLLASSSSQPLFASDVGEQSASPADLDKESQEKAVTQAQQFVAELELERGSRHPDLTEPLLSLANSLLDNNQLLEAEDVSRKGQYITHLTDGVLTLEQLPFLDILTEVYLSTEQVSEANRQQEFSYYLGQHQNTIDPIEQHAAIEKLGNWYLRTGQFNRSRRMLTNYVRTIEGRTGTDELKQIETLRLLAKNAQLKSTATCCGLDELRKIVSILENNPGATDPDLIRAYLEMGDAFVLKKQKGQRAQMEMAGSYYKKAWNLASQNHDAKARFDHPVLIARIDLLDGGRSGFGGSHRGKTYLRMTSSPFIPRANVPRGMTAAQLAHSLKNQGFEEENLDIPPREVWVLPDSHNTDVIINDSGTSQFNGEKFIAVTGQPFRFIQRQLYQILPSRFKDPENLAEIEISFSFAVDSDGNTSEIELIKSNAPKKLYRQVLEALEKSKFRPRLADGNRVKSSNEKLTQTFR